MQSDQSEKAKSPPTFPQEAVQKTFYSVLTCFCQSAATLIYITTFYSLTLSRNRQAIKATQ